MIAAESTNNTKTPRISLRNMRSDRLFRFNHPMCKEVHLMIASTTASAPHSSASPIACDDDEPSGVFEPPLSHLMNHIVFQISRGWLTPNFGSNLGGWGVVLSLLWKP